MNSPEKIIVVADDDRDDQELLEEVLLGIEKDALVITFSSGKEVLHYLDKCEDNKKPCLIILDYNMPDLNGAQLTEIIYRKESFKTIPVLVWSTSNSAVYRLECEQKGAKQYFYKPHDFNQIIAMAKEMLSYCDLPVPHRLP